MYPRLLEVLPPTRPNMGTQDCVVTDQGECVYPGLLEVLPPICNECVYPRLLEVLPPTGPNVCTQDC